jgi:hypothetical protein
MATDEELLREHVLARAVVSIPRGFLVEFNERVTRAYAEEFAEIAHKPARLAEQRIFNLAQDRCFRIDWELYEAAKAYGLPATPRPLPENKWHHTYVIAEEFGLTQSYVQRLGDLPQPAKFREKLAAAANFPRLPLDDPAEIYAIKNFYTLFAHNPLGRSFCEQDQRLGSLMFCVPDQFMKRWTVEISVAELISYYPVEKKQTKTDRGPTWKKQTDQEPRTP